MDNPYLAIAAFLLVLTTGFFWFRLVYAVKLPDNRAGFLLCMLAGIGLGVASLWQSPGVMSAVLAVLAIACGGMFVLTWAISPQKGGPGKLTPGTRLIPFTSTDHLGNRFDSQILAGKPVLLKFFRGHW